MATRLTALAVQIEAIGVEKVKGALREVEREAQRAGKGIAGATNTAGPDKFARSARSMAAGLGQVAASGNLAGAGMKQIVIQGAEMALIFGPGGPIVAAIGLMGLGIYNMFARTRKEIADTARAARAELRSLTLASGNELLQQMYSGDFTADPGTPEALGRGGAERRLAEVQRAIAAAGGKTAVTDIMTGQTLTGSASPALVAEEERLQTFLTKTAERYTNIKNRVTELVAVEVERTTIAAREDARTRGIRDGEKLGDARMRIAGEAGRDAGMAVSDILAARLGQELGKDGEDVMRKRLAAAAVPTPADFAAAAAAGSDRLAGEWSGLTDVLIPESPIMAAAKERAKEMAEGIGAMMKQTLGDSVYNAFSAAFNGEGLSGIFKSFGKTILAGLGQIFTQMGMTYLSFGKIMASLQKLLFNPVTAGPAAMAIGIALIGLGAALGAMAGGGGGRGTASAGAYREPYSYTRPGDLVQIKLVGTQKSPASSLVPSSTVMNITLIGENDPAAAAALRRMVDGDKRRG